MNPKKASWYFLVLLILAGESVFILPFVLSRVFRPIVLEAFDLDNIELGLCFAVYGIVALLSYLFGGPLADKFPPRKLIAVALWMTALGGFIYATFPGFNALKILYGYWGFTTIFLFWAPMIKATRVWGGATSQGKAFGFLDGGRGLVGALFGTMGVIVFSFFLTSEISHATIQESKIAFKQVILISSGIVIVVGILVWFFMKLDPKTEQELKLEQITFSQIKQVLRLPSVWLLMIIILCAYVGYKITDVFSLYAQDVMQYNQVQSAQIGTFLLFIRPIIGVFIGILADRWKTTALLFVSFIITFLGALLLAFGLISESTTILFLISILIVASGVYAARCLYFAVMEKGQIPLKLTGTAVGLISLVGFTPDIFAGPAMGFLLENSKGASGHQHVFWMLALFSLIGCVAAWRYFRLYKKNE
ncbi:MFS transporter [Fluviicola taffensis]|uniref:Major facilitator superfamily MFS_1 n=1 Tax=Fluviicola taffensis (strain DSM 16823 / NCIMB 13979 / RW262) TaxID=755732 RepID=F2IFT3_FLUTR|nr:MFS transporter [Fluviicola taffensis]AEA42541.1 major facilitator superfamily MFS_1 [Fluviicola taffensis DSM 16823]